MSLNRNMQVLDWFKASNNNLKHKSRQNIAAMFSQCYLTD